MLKKTIKFTNVLGEKEEAIAYFNLNNVEYLRLAAKVGQDGDLAKGLRAAVEANNLNRMISIIEEVLLSAYGIRPAEDMSGFVKTQAARDMFSSSEPYSELFMELLNNPEELNNFVSSLVDGVKLNPTVDMQAIRAKADQSLTQNLQA